MRKIFCSVTLLVGGAVAGAWAQPVSFPKVEIRYNSSSKEPARVHQSGVLSLDATAKKLSFQPNAKGPSFETTYDNIKRVVFDPVTHERGGGFAVLGAMGGGVGAIGAIKAERPVSGYWMVVEYTQPDGHVEKAMLEIPANESLEVEAAIKAMVGDRARTAEVRLASMVKNNTLKEYKANFRQSDDWKDRPMPELKPGMALVVVVCPRHFVLTANQWAGQYRLHANDRVILVNRQGTYGFANLEPGDYQLASQTAMASLLPVTLEADKAYYFLQVPMSNGANQLSQHSEEIVMHELSGTAYSRWERLPSK